MALLGVDIGTSGTKANVFDLDGTILGSGEVEYPTQHPKPGWAELDSGLVFDRVCESIREAVGKAGAAGDGAPAPRRRIEAICFTSMGEAAVPVSADRRILGSSILGTDSRGAEYVTRLTHGFDPIELYTINPNIPGPSYTMPKLCWLAEHRRGLYDAADYFLSWADCVPFLLGCEAVTNFAHANRTLLFDIRQEGWSEDLVGAAGLDGRKLAPTVPTGHVLGPISADGAKRLGLSNRPVVVAGAHDQCCNAVGAGAIDAGDAVCGIGTVECITPVYDEIPDPKRMLAAGLNVEHHAVGGRYVSFIYNQAGLLVRWYRDTFAARPPGGDGSDGGDRAAATVPVAAAPTSYDALFAELPDGPSGLLVLPYFEPTGAPYFVNDACGAIVGLTPDTSRGRILKGLLEGETYYFVESMILLESLGVGTTELVASGGGARSDAWLQIKADVLGLPTVRVETTEAGTLGAAIVAGAAAGIYGSVREGVRAAVRRGDRFAPNPARHEAYREWYQRYRRLYVQLEDLLTEVRHAAVQR